MEKIFFFILFNSILFNLHCQSPRLYLENLPVEQGLKNHEFNCIMQDHTGIIWIGGATGLYKHDGYDVTYVNDHHNGRIRSFGVIYKMAEDSLGFIWLLTDTGIRLYDPQKESSMLVYQHREGCFWITMHADSRGNIWASDLAGLLKITYRKNSIAKEDIFKQGAKNVFKIDLFLIPTQRNGDQNVVFSINHDAQGNLYLGCAQGLFLLMKGKHRLIRLDTGTQDGNPHEIQFAREILPIDENSMWILDSRKLYMLSNIKKALQGNKPDVSQLNFSQKLNDEENIKFLARDRKKNFIIMLEKSICLIKIDRETGEISLESLGYNTTYPGDMEHRFNVNDMFEDMSGVFWITQTYNGVSKFKMKQLVFDKITELNIQNPYNLKVGNIFKDTLENLWVVVNNKALYKIQHGDNRITRYDPGPDRTITCFAPARAHGLWIGSNNGILEFNFRSGKFQDRLPNNSTVKNLKNARILNILEKPYGLFIASSIGGLFYNFENERLYKVAFSDPNAYGYQLMMKDGTIWASGGFYGIFKISYDRRNDVLDQSPIVIQNIGLDADIISSYDKIGMSTDAELELSTNIILYEDASGYLWVGNESGIHRINLKTRRTKSYTIFENTDFQNIMSITSDKHNHLWLGTYNKLCRLNMSTGKIKVFEEEDGVPDINYVRNSIYKDNQGRIYLGGYGGLYSFHPDSILTNNNIPPVVITKLLLFNEPVRVKTSRDAILTRNISYTKSIELKYNQNNLSFEFAALDYNHSSQNKYAYKLQGYEKEWKYTDAKNRRATYNNLEPGKYVFRVMGSNNDDIWNEEGASLNIMIHKPWWSTFLALSIYLLIILGLILGYIRWRLWQLKKEKLELERLVNVRTSQIEEQKEEIRSQRDMLEVQNQQIAEQEKLKSRFFANVSHEFRTPLTLIQSPVEELLDDPRRIATERRKLNMVQRNVRRLLQLVNQLLDISKLDASKMKLELAEADVIGHLRAITGAFTSLAETKSILYSCHFPPFEKKFWFDSDKLEKIACNLLSNAFKFTPEGGEIIFTAFLENSEDPLVDKYLEFSVRDNGKGIPGHSLEKIFDRFYQVEESLKSEGGGTGIGLSLTRDIVKLLHGDIRVESTHGKGSTFTVIIPLGKNHLKESEFTLLKEAPEKLNFQPDLQISAEEPASIKNEKSQDKKPIILIIEDNRDIRVQLAENFTRNYIILDAIDGFAGLKKAVESIPDLIITDLMMPRMDGMELCEKLKNDQRTSHIPVIMLTAKDTLEDKITGYLSGADDYIPKPFHMAELKARVANLIEQRMKLRERFSREITLQPGDIAVTPLDEKFLDKAIKVVEKHMDDENFDLAELREEMNMTRSTLARKLHALTGQSPTEFIRTIRLKRAASLLKQHFGNVTQVSLEVGFNNLSYFNRSFKKLFGVSPVEFVKEK